MLLLGGAGFIGSRIARGLCEVGHKVVVIDGLMEDTGGNQRHIESIQADIKFVGAPINEVKNIRQFISAADYVIDCMAWTSHRLSMDRPSYDLALNAQSHLHVIEALRSSEPRPVIYLGSRSQYGRAATNPVTENTVQRPVDIQGIHKVAAESYYRIFSEIIGIPVVSLRICNVFGPNQPTVGEDIGLMGHIFRSCILDQTVEIYRQNGVRQVLYVDDLVEVVMRVADVFRPGYSVYNVAGPNVNLVNVTQCAVEILGSGHVKEVDMPIHIARMYSGDCILSTDEFVKDYGVIPEHDLVESIKKTLTYFKENIQQE